MNSKVEEEDKKAVGELKRVEEENVISIEGNEMNEVKYQTILQIIFQHQRWNNFPPRIKKLKKTTI